MSKASGSIDLKALKVAGEPNKYITKINDNGITVHAANNSSLNYIAINANGMEIFKSDEASTPSAISVAYFGETVRIGARNTGNIIIQSSGIAVRDGLTELATFGASGTRIGSENTNKVAISLDGITMTDIDGVESFSVGASANAETGEIVEMTSSENEYELIHTPASGSSITVTRHRLVETPKPHIVITRYYFAQGQASSESNIHYDGGKTFTGVETGDDTYYISYFSDIVPPYMTFGTRTEVDRIATGSEPDIEYSKGGYSSTFGKELVAEHFQTVIGQANILDANGDFAFIIGNGKPSLMYPGYRPVRSNAMAVDWEGNVNIKGDLTVGCNDDSTGGTKVFTEAGGVLTGSLTVEGHDSPIGTIIDIDTTTGTVSHSTNFAYVGDCKMTLPAGVWLLTCSVYFPASTSAYRYGVAIGTGSAGSTTVLTSRTTHRYEANTGNRRLSTTGVATSLGGQVVGASAYYKATSGSSISCEAVLRAVRLA